MKMLFLFFSLYFGTLIPANLGWAEDAPAPTLSQLPPVLHAPPRIVESLPDMVERVSPGVVNISSTTVIQYSVLGWDEFARLWRIPQEKKQTSLGSGFIIDYDGFILTNNHVVQNATEVMVILEDKRQFRAKIVGKDEKTDLALLQIGNQNKNILSSLKPVKLGDSDQVRRGESVITLGNPFGFQNTLTHGVISAKERSIGSGPLNKFLQTDASINPGNSGGPLINQAGEVIGINSTIYSPVGQSAGVGFAIPINDVKKVLPDLKKYGRVLRPYIGIQSVQMNIQLEQYLGLSISKGVLVVNLDDAGPAARAGLIENDVIVSVDGITVLEPHDIEKAINDRRPKDTVTVQVYRGRKLRQLTISLGTLPPLEKLPEGVI